MLGVTAGGARAPVPPPPAESAPDNNRQAQNVTKLKVTLIYFASYL